MWLRDVYNIRSKQCDHRACRGPWHVRIPNWFFFSNSSSKKVVSLKVLVKKDGRKFGSVY